MKTHQRDRELVVETKFDGLNEEFSSELAQLNLTACFPASKTPWAHWLGSRLSMP
jgi:hypothetical protein